MLYLSFKFVRKFKFCVSPLVKRYSGPYCLDQVGSDTGMDSSIRFIKQNCFYHSGTHIGLII